MSSPASVESRQGDPLDAVVQARIVDSRPRVRRLVAPLLTAAGVLAATAYISQVNPNEPGHYPTCPTQWLLGIDCPGCGMMRATYCLTQGDIPGAIDNNLLMIVAVPAAVILWVMWVARAWRGVTPQVTARQARFRTRLTIVVLVVILAFGVIRNLTPLLGSGIG